MTERDWNAVVAIAASTAIAVIVYSVVGLWAGGWGELVLWLVTIGWLNLCLNLGTSIGRWIMGKPVKEVIEKDG